MCTGGGIVEMCIEQSMEWKGDATRRDVNTTKATFIMFVED